MLSDKVVFGFRRFCRGNWWIRTILADSDDSGRFWVGENENGGELVNGGVSIIK